MESDKSFANGTIENIRRDPSGKEAPWCCRSFPSPTLCRVPTVKACNDTLLPLPYNKNRYGTHLFRPMFPSTDGQIKRGGKITPGYFTAPNDRNGAATRIPDDTEPSPERKKRNGFPFRLMKFHYLYLRLRAASDFFLRLTLGFS